VSARPDFTLSIAAIGVGLAIAGGRILKDGPMDTRDWLFAIVGLGVAAVAGGLLARELLRK